ncbi:cadmium resistance transporter [Gloeocapsa sp. PCC 73106]|uniref:cadmium resistance transporter n=1 Tax=Gloeocapsa sp. PCC 73106 TaxID=102232 RepID=UPI0002AC44F0|nr:cadmium resistance transporter [Gloeocapsa sp. PCC 73106]ELR98860.1 putative permease, cadmium resistance protein [Gloeocapsa sp. PCC 73106]
MNDLITAIATFTVTNIDDMLILIVLFAQGKVLFSRQQIIIGQYLGFILLILVSIPGFFGSLLIPSHWIRGLGLIPIFLGLTYVNKTDSSSPVINSYRIYSVAAITVANGGDNIGVYFPLFANSKAHSLIIIVITFLFLVGVWCLIAYRLTYLPAIASLLEVQGNIFTPCVLIALGIYIVKQNLSLTLFTLIISYLWVMSLNVYSKD